MITSLPKYINFIGSPDGSYLSMALRLGFLKLNNLFCRICPHFDIVLLCSEFLMTKIRSTEMKYSVMLHTGSVMYSASNESIGWVQELILGLSVSTCGRLYRQPL